MTAHRFFLILHGEFAGEGLMPPTHLNYCIHAPYSRGESYVNLLDQALELARQFPEELGNFEKLERVGFYSSTSQPYMLPGQEFLWLAGLIPHPQNKDPSWMG